MGKKQIVGSKKQLRVVGYTEKWALLYGKQKAMNTSVTTKFPFQEKLIALFKSLTSLHSIYVVKMDKAKSKQVTYLSPQNEQSQTQAIYILLVIGRAALDKNLDDLMEEV